MGGKKRRRFRSLAWAPAFAGVTNVHAGVTNVHAGVTNVHAGVTNVHAG
jgi:hypothetical protein